MLKPRATGYKPVVRFNNVKSLGGEGGIRTHDPVLTGYRFSRAEPSAARPPLQSKAQKL